MKMEDIKILAKYIRGLTMNNDVFRVKGYPPLSVDQCDHMQSIRLSCQALYELINRCQSSFPAGARELAIAKTRLEEVSMWALKGISN